MVHTECLNLEYFTDIGILQLILGPFNTPVLSWGWFCYFAKVEMNITNYFPLSGFFQA